MKDFELIKYEFFNWIADNVWFIVGMVVAGLVILAICL